MHPVLVDLSFIYAPLKLYTYGFMIMLGFLVGMQLGAREARRIDVSKEGGFDQFILDLTFWILVASIVGARTLFIIVEWTEGGYGQDPSKIFKFWEGGFVFYGGLIGAVLFSIYYCQKKGRNFFLVADTLIPYVALGQFFGRLGCIAAGCCWGVETHPDFPFSVQFPQGALAHSSMLRSGIIAPGDAWTPHIHPVQLYESIGALTIFFILIGVRSMKRFHGQVLLGYVFMYPILRTSLEFIRGDKERGEYLLAGFTVSTSQIISGIIAMGAVSLTVFFLFRNRQTKSKP